MDQARPPRPIVVPPGGGTDLDFLAITHKLTGAQTGGAFYIAGRTSRTGLAASMARSLHRQPPSV